MVTLLQEFSCFGTATDKSEALEGNRYSNLVPSSLKKAEKWKVIVKLKTFNKNRSFLSALEIPALPSLLTPQEERFT